MACAKNINLFHKPIICVNVDGFYNDFRNMLIRADNDKLMRLKPEEIISFADSAEEAIRIMEELHLKAKTLQQNSTLPKMEVKSEKSIGRKNGWEQNQSSQNKTAALAEKYRRNSTIALTFAVGGLVGFLLAAKKK